MPRERQRNVLDESILDYGLSEGSTELILPTQSPDTIRNKEYLRTIWKEFTLDCKTQAGLDVVPSHHWLKTFLRVLAQRKGNLATRVSTRTLEEYVRRYQGIFRTEYGVVITTAESKSLVAVFGPQPDHDLL
jgi:hypothetical protein